MRWLSLPLLLLVACTDSFEVGPMPDGSADAGPFDAAFPATDATATRDAEVPRADAGSLSRCEVTTGPTVGDGCFCRGPIVATDDYVYRQSLGIQVFARDRFESPVFVVDERPSAQGGLVRVGEHLVSAVDFEDPALRVYSLADPARPVFVVGFGDGAGSPIRLAADGHFVVAAHHRDERVAVVLYDLTRPTRPARVFERTLDGSALAVAVAPSGVFVIEADVSRDRGQLLWLDLDGTERASLAIVDPPYEPSLAIRDELVYFTGGTARLTRVRARADSLRVVDVVGEPIGVGTAIAFDDGLVVLGSLDVYEESSLRPLATTDTFGGYSNLAVANGALYASSGGGVTELLLRCE
ncbi:MAG: hypothetical protein MUE69_21480 [Myxococcota bacterium]|jgi:hypothetical protein|nr:hypothetical protein [Myxococcota bacterium]